MICSEKDDLKSELSFISDTFHKINGNPLRVIKKSQERIKEKMTTSTDTTDEDTLIEENEEKKQPFIIVPYAGKQGEKIMSKIAKKMPEEVRPRIVYNGTKLSTAFQ